MCVPGLSHFLHIREILLLGSTSASTQLRSPQLWVSALLARLSQLHVYPPAMTWGFSFSLTLLQASISGDRLHCR